MASVKPRGKVPKEASIGDIIEIKTLLRHPMHSGRMRDTDGNIIPRKIVNKFYANFNGELIFSMGIEPSISSNPYIVFPFRVMESGTFEFFWIEDSGEKYQLSRKISVS